jgi:hypothetical protein
VTIVFAPSVSAWATTNSSFLTLFPAEAERNRVVSLGEQARSAAECGAQPRQFLNGGGPESNESLEAVGGIVVKKVDVDGIAQAVLV